ncbi:thiamine pyrophosphokinase [Spirochaetia bacterium]|nr:thiamine pyrophosphokinase [Spirochaetia bacterium]
MTGIAFIGGEGPGVMRCKELAGGADLIAAADSGLLLAERACITPDWIVGDMDSLDEQGGISLLDKYPKDRVLIYPCDKDLTDTEIALNLLWEKGCDKTIIAGGGGGRIDHIFALRSLFERERTPDLWVTAGEAVYKLDAKVNCKKEFFTEKNTVVSVYPVGASPCKAESYGLKWSLNGIAWTMGAAGISNIALEERWTINVVSGSFLIVVNF